MSQFFLTIARIDQTIFEGHVDSVTLPTTEGEITVLPKHVPLISLLRPGSITVRQGQRSTTHLQLSGILEITKNEVAILIAE